MISTRQKITGGLDFSYPADDGDDPLKPSRGQGTYDITRVAGDRLFMITDEQGVLSMSEDFMKNFGISFSSKHLLGSGEEIDVTIVLPELPSKFIDFSKNTVLIELQSMDAGSLTLK